MKHTAKFAVIVFGLLACLSCPLVAQTITTYYDLVDPSIEEISIGATKFRAELLPGTSGTGGFDTFLRLSGSPTEQGYNTSASKVMDNMDGKWTHDLRVGELSVVQDLQGRYMVSLGMDLNEPNAAGSNYQSLDAFRVYVSPDGSQSVLNPGDLGQLVYDMDAGGDNAVLLDINRNSSGGSGRSDLNIYLDLDLFGKTSYDSYVYFYVKMGGVGLGEAPQYPTLDFSNDGGFDELRRDLTIQSVATVPEPSTILPLILGVGILSLRRTRARGPTPSSCRHRSE